MAGFEEIGGGGGCLAVRCSSVLTVAVLSGFSDVRAAIACGARALQRAKSVGGSLRARRFAAGGKEEAIAGRGFGSFGEASTPSSGILPPPKLWKALLLLCSS